MSEFKVGDRVRFEWIWSALHGATGTVVGRDDSRIDHLSVKVELDDPYRDLDGDKVTYFFPNDLIKIEEQQ